MGLVCGSEFEGEGMDGGGDRGRDGGEGEGRAVGGDWRRAFTWRAGVKSEGASSWGKASHRGPVSSREWASSLGQL